MALIIYRLNSPISNYHPAGLGPYAHFSPINTPNEVISLQIRLPHMPSPGEDNICFDNGLHPGINYHDILCNDAIPRSWVCGFASLEQLNGWFNADYIRKIRKFDMAIHEYEVPNACVKVGRHQAMFNSQKIVSVSTKEDCFV